MTPTTALINQLITDLDTGRDTGRIYTYGQVQERLRAIVAAEAEAVVLPSECDHEFTDHCVFCGVDAHEWFNHYAKGVQS